MPYNGLPEYTEETANEGASISKPGGSTPCQEREKIRKEIQAAIIDLEVLTREIGYLCHREIIRRLRVSENQQQKLMEHVNEFFFSTARDEEVEQHLETLCEKQRELLLRVSQRFYFCGRPPPAQIVSKDKIADFILWVSRRRNNSPRGGFPKKERKWRDN